MQNTNVAIPAGLTKKDFYKNYVARKVKSNINTGAVVFYISAGLTFLMGLLNNALGASLIDVAIAIAVGLGIQLGKSRACAWIGTIYGVFSMIMGLIVYGKLTSWLLIIAGICAIIGTTAFNKQWKQYLTNSAAVFAAPAAPVAMPVEATEAPAAVEEAVAEEAAVVEEAVAEEAAVVEEAVAEEAAVVEEAVAEEAAVVEEAVAEEAAVVEEAVAEEAAVVEEAVAEEAAVVEEAVAEEAVAVEETVAE